MQQVSQKSDVGIASTTRASYCCITPIYGPIWNTVWKPYRKEDILCLEKVQRRATKMVYELKHLEYDERLHRLGLCTMQEEEVT